MRVINGLSTLAVVICTIIADSAPAASIVVVENPEQFDSGFGLPPGTPDLWRAYDVYNNSDIEGEPVQVVAVVVTNPEPLTEWIRDGWTATEVTSAEVWNQPMRGEFAEEGGDLTWSEFFGGAAYPGPANGYYLDYVLDGIALAFGGNPIEPGEASIGELWFAGPIASEFLVAAAPAGADLSALDPGALVTFSGTAAVPEPATFRAAVMAVCSLAALERRRPPRSRRRA